MKKTLFSIIILFFYITNIKADIQDYNGSSVSNLGGLGDGGWVPQAVGLKISIVSSSNSLEDTELIVNSFIKDNYNNSYYAASVKPKTKQSTTINWTKGKNVTKTKSDHLPDNWISNNKNIDIHNLLSKDNYSKLKSLLNIKVNSSKIFSTLSAGDFILVEPMTYIGNYVGTAFELSNAFSLTSKCSTSGSFCWTYSGTIFGGSSKKPNGGVFYNTIFIDTNVSAVGLDYFSNSDRSKRNSCFMSKSCGRGIGVYEYNNIYPQGNLEITKVDYSDSTKKISGAGFTLYKDSKCGSVLKSEQKTNSNGITTFENITPGTYYYKETKTPTNYKANSTCYSFTIESGKTTKKTIKNEIKKGVIKIKKIKSNGEPLKSKQIGFAVYNNASCTGTAVKASAKYTTNSNGIIEITNLPQGINYYVKETETPEPYVLPDNNCFGPFTVGGSSVKVKNQTACEKEMTNNSSIQNRINKYRSTYTTYNNLLDFRIPDPVTMCDNYTPTYTKSESCLEAEQATTTKKGSQNITFYSENISGYNDTVKDDTNNIVGYCTTTFVFDKQTQLPTSPVKAGMLILESNMDDIAAIGTLTKTCYIFTNRTTNFYDNSEKKSYKDYITKVELDDNELIPSTNAANRILMQYDSTAGNGLHKFVGTATVNYKFNPVYVEKMNGQICSTATPKCRLIGYGIISQFKDAHENSTGGQSHFNFKITSGFNKFSFNSTGSNCNYLIEEEIITYEGEDEDLKSNLEIEFRSIDPNNPFERPTNTNWCNGSNCGSNNTTVKNNILKRTNSYGNKEGVPQEPIYRIVLSPSDIEIIRDYNEANKYSDYELTCELDAHGNNVCINSFISSLINGDYIYGSSRLSNRLIKN